MQMINMVTSQRQILEFNRLDYSPYAENISVSGAHWQGKNMFIAKGILELLLRKVNVWVWDYNGAFTRYLNPRQDWIRYNIDDLEYGTQFIKPRDKSEGNFIKFCKKVVEHRNLIVVLDEIHNYCSAQRISSQLGEVIRNAGNQGISYIALFQRPAEIHKSIVSNALHRFVFAFDVPTDVQYLRTWLGIEVELFLPIEQRSYHAESLSHIQQLPQYSFVYRHMHELRCKVSIGGIKL